MVDESIIHEAGRRLVEAAPGARVILFGSHARGDAGPDSDLDLLVVASDVTDRHREMVRLARVLRPLGVPTDVVVVTRRYVEEWASVPGTMVHAALRDGRELSDAA